MNREQADKIIAVIAKDATGKGTYFPTEDTECVIGGLWLATGGSRSTQTITTVDIKTAYGLDHSQQALLVDTNDAYDDVTERRVALIALVNSWVEQVGLDARCI